MLNKAKLILASLIMSSVAGTCNATSLTHVSRYSTIENKPTVAQLNPLLGLQQMRFSRDVITIDQAVNNWLKHTGYSLVKLNKQSKDTQEILNQKLPQVDRNLGPLTVKEGLEVLVGKDVFHLVQDPLHRKINFELNKKYQRIYKAKAKG